MKKLTALLLAAVMIFALCACSSNTEPAVEDEGNTQVANPMVEVSDVELQNSLGVVLSAPEGAENVKYFLIGGSLGEVQFNYNGAEYSYRAQKTDEFEDISGVYFTTPETNDSDAGCTIAVMADGSMGAAAWYTDGFSYAISMGEGATTNVLQAMYDLLTA